jgi:folate-binding protein YgfZ
MSEAKFALSPAATVVAGLLVSADPPPPCTVYHGVLTPTELDARPGEIEALISAAAVHDLGWLRRVAVRGNDRFRWLSGMVTNMVKDLEPNAGAWNLVLNVQGRIQGDLTVWRDNDDLELEIAADQTEKLLAHLDHFIIMDDVELVPVEDVTAIGLSGPKATEALGRLGLPVLDGEMTQTRAEWSGTQLIIRRGYGTLGGHYAIWIAPSQAVDLWQALGAAGAKPVGTTALDDFRIAEGIPTYGIDMVERDLPQETSQLRALHYNKGCYLGQEIVERIRSRGNVHRHLRQLELEGPVPEPGTKLTLDDTEVGHITSAAELPLGASPRTFAIGMIRAEAEARNLPLNYAAGEATGAARILATPPSL